MPKAEDDERVRLKALLNSTAVTMTAKELGTLLCSTLDGSYHAKIAAVAIDRLMAFEIKAANIAIKEGLLRSRKHLIHCGCVDSPKQSLEAVGFPELTDMNIDAEEDYSFSRRHLRILLYAVDKALEGL